MEIKKEKIKPNEVAARQIVNQVQHFLRKFRLEFSNQDTSWGDY